jgi:hypothetical protein
MNPSHLSVSESSHPLVPDLVDTVPAIPVTPLIPAFQNDGAKVTMRLFGRSDQNLLMFGLNHLTAMEDNAYFMEPNPSQESLSTLLEAFAGDCAEVRILKAALAAAVAAKNARRETLTQQLTQRANYVQSMSWGNKMVITSSALGVQRQRHKVGPLAAPLNLQVVQEVSEGAVTVTWGRVKHALLYILEYGAEGETPKQIPLCGRRKKSLNLPKLGATYVFRIKATGTSGDSNWSPPVRRIAG